MSKAVIQSYNNLKNVEDVLCLQKNLMIQIQYKHKHIGNRRTEQQAFTQKKLATPLSPRRSILQLHTDLFIQ